MTNSTLIILIIYYFSAILSIDYSKAFVFPIISIHILGFEIILVSIISFLKKIELLNWKSKKTIPNICACHFIPKKHLTSILLLHTFQNFCAHIKIFRIFFVQKPYIFIRIPITTHIILKTQIQKKGKYLYIFEFPRPKNFSFWACPWACPWAGPWASVVEYTFDIVLVTQTG